MDLSEKARLLKQRYDDYLQDNVNQPLSDMGYPNVGAGIAAASSTAADYLVPESPLDLVPGKAVGRAFKAVKGSGARDIDDVLKQAAERFGTGSTEYSKLVVAAREANGDLLKFKSILTPVENIAESVKRADHKADAIKAFKHEQPDRTPQVLPVKYEKVDESFQDKLAADQSYAGEKAKFIRNKLKKDGLL